MQLPMRAVSMVSMNPLESSATSAASMDKGRALSGECGPDDVGLEDREVDLDDPVEVWRGVADDLSIRGHEGRVGVGEVGEVAAAGGAEVAFHALVVWEHGGGRAELGAHVGDGGLAGAANGGCAGAEVLDDGVCAA